VADPDEVLADRMQAELRVEGRHAVDLRDRDAALPVDLGDPLTRDVAVDLLGPLQERYQAALLTGKVLFLEVEAAVFAHGSAPSALPQADINQLTADST
jgi:hypothetical protein